MVFLFREIFFLISFSTVVKLIVGVPMERTKLTEEFVVCTYMTLVPR